MSRTLFTLLLILAVVLCPHRALAQQSSLTAERSKNENAALREKALDLLESAAGQLGTLQSPENRARLGANIADSLWDHDEKRARALFALVEDDVRAGMANRDLADPKDLHTLKVFLKLRQDTTERIAKHDGELALAFFKSTEFISDKPLPPALKETNENFELRLAKQIANNNPELAVKLIRKSLDHGFSEDTLRLLRQLNRKNKEQALIVYKEIVNKLRDADFTKDWSVRYFAQNLIQTFKPPTPNDPTFRQLIGILVTAALANGCGNRSPAEDENAEFCRFVASLMPQMEKLDPRAAQLKRWIPQGEYPDVTPEAVHEFYDLLEEGSVDGLLAFAAGHPDLSDEILWHAITKANEAGDFDKARKIATERIADPERKQELLALIDRGQNWRKTSEKEMVQIQVDVSQIANPVDRVRILLSYANRFGDDRNVALKLIKQANDVADAMKPGREQTEARTSLALMYCLEENDRGFAIMESLMPKLNELVDAAIKLDGYETSYIRDGEWNMSANGTTGALLTRLSQNAGVFAWSDFDRAVSLAAQFDRSEIRLMAQVKLAQAILAGRPKRLQIDYGYDY